MNEKPLTSEEQHFAAENHDLIYRFLQTMGLPEDKYYDIIVFGFLKAVKEHFAEAKSHQQFAFADTAWRAMLESIPVHYRVVNRRNSRQRPLSINTAVQENSVQLSEGKYLSLLNAQLTLQKLEDQVTRQQLAIIDMITDGYDRYEIAHRQNLPVNRVCGILEEVYALL